MSKLLKNHRAPIALVSSSILLATLGIESANAASNTSISTPSSPNITSITSVQSGEKVNLTISLTLPENNGGSAILGTKVSAKGANCNIAKTKASCVIKNLPIGKTFNFIAQSKNKKGFGSPSTAYTFTTSGVLITKPGAPTVTSIVSSAPLKNKVNLVVSYQLPANNGGTPILGSEVLASGSTCKSSKLGTSCTLKNVKMGKTLSITVLSKNKKGNGPKSTPVSYTVNGTNWAPPTAAVIPPISSSPTPLTFDLQNATGIGIVGLNAQSFSATSVGDFSSMQSSQPGLQVTKTDGSIANAIASGSADVVDVLNGSDGKIYLKILKTNSTVGGVTNCVLAVIERNSPNPECVDPELTDILFQGVWGNPALQFDEAGNIYYLGYIKGKFTLRKKSGGVIYPLVNDNIGVTDFLVLPDGTIFMIGESENVGSRWLRKLSPQGTISNISTERVNFVRQFADGNLYYGVTSYNTSEFGVRRIELPSLSIDSQFWISNGYNNPVNSIQSACNNWNRYFGYCAATGTAIMNSYNILGAKTFVTAGWSANSVLMKYWPTVEVMNSSVSKVTTSKAVAENIFLAGLNTSGKNILTVFNTGSEVETQILGPDNETEIYHLEFSSATNRILFDGLRFSDNKYVFGYVDLSNLNVRYFSTISSKWSAFKTFN